MPLHARHGTSASVGSRSPSVTFSDYVPVLGDYVYFFVTSNTVEAITTPATWTNVLGGNTTVDSDAHTACAVYRPVTAGEVSGVTTTYTATNLFNNSVGGRVNACVIRDADTVTLIDAAGTASNAASTTSHSVAGLSGASLSTGSMVLGGVASGPSNSYTHIDGWELIARNPSSSTTGVWLGAKHGYTTAGVNVSAATITASSSDEYASITVAVIPADIPSLPDLDFVTIDSSGDLMVDGDRYRFAGTNCGSTNFQLSENVNSGTSNYGGIIVGSVHNPSHFQLEETIASAVAMNTTVIRTFGFLCIDKTLSLSPSLGVVDNFDSLDYAMWLCRLNGIRVVAPLVDNYAFFMGGRNGWCTRSGVSASAANFYTNATVIANFKAHITAVLDHINVYTGIAYKDDPAIVMWETGNELDIGSGAWNDDYSAWTVDIAEHIKDTVEAQQLVADGKNSVYGDDDTPDLTVLESPYVDCFSSHPYRDVNGPEYYMAQAPIAASYGKAYFLGEGTWTDSSTSGVNEWKLPEMLSMTLGTDECDGYLFWETHAPLVNHGDGFALHYPGDDEDMQCRVQQLTDHAGLMADGFVAPITIRNAIGASLNSPHRSATFNSNYTPKANDYVILFGSSVSVRSLGAVSGWTNLLGGTTVLNSDAHTLAVVGRFVTALEEANGTLTYTASNLFDATTSGGTCGVVLRGVDPTNPVDAVGTLTDSTTAVTPHTLAGVTGVSDNSLVLSCICKDSTGTYETPLGYGFLASATANQALWLMSGNTPGDVAETDIEISSSDEYISVTVALRTTDVEAPPSSGDFFLFF